MTDSRQQSRFRAVDALTRDFLIWLEDAPRTYADAMEVWRTSCPRFSIWEDALADGLVQIASAPGRSSTQDRVTLTSRGRAMVGASPPAGQAPLSRFPREPGTLRVADGE